jgi:hypothetical protein
MNGDRDESTRDAGSDEELNLIEEEQEDLEPDTSPEAGEEAKLTEKSPDPVPVEEIEFEDDSGAGT